MFKITGKIYDDLKQQRYKLMKSEGFFMLLFKDFKSVISYDEYLTKYHESNSYEGFLNSIIDLLIEKGISDVCLNY